VAARFINPHGIATSAMTVLPMSLIPTFAVPLFLILHFISIAQARQWQEQPYPRVAEPLPSSGL
jgi:riboflavin transporter FmnP